MIASGLAVAVVRAHTRKASACARAWHGRYIAALRNAASGPLVNILSFCCGGVTPGPHVSASPAAHRPSLAVSQGCLIAASPQAPQTPGAPGVLGPCGVGVRGVSTLQPSLRGLVRRIRSAASDAARADGRGSQACASSGPPSRSACTATGAGDVASLPVTAFPGISWRGGCLPEKTGGAARCRAAAAVRCSAGSRHGVRRARSQARAVGTAPGPRGAGACGRASSAAGGSMLMLTGHLSLAILVLLCPRDGPRSPCGRSDFLIGKVKVVELLLGNPGKSFWVQNWSPGFGKTIILEPAVEFYHTRVCSERALDQALVGGPLRDRARHGRP